MYENIYDSGFKFHIEDEYGCRIGQATVPHIHHYGNFYELTIFTGSSVLAHTFKYLYDQGVLNDE